MIHNAKDNQFCMKIKKCVKALNSDLVQQTIGVPQSCITKHIPTTVL